MSGSIGRSYLIQQWNDASSYSGEMIGQRLKQSTDLFLANGKANIGLFEEKPKAPAKKKTAFQSISLADSNYERLCGLSDALDTQLDNGELSFEDWTYARRQIDQRLAKAWSRLCRARNWSESGEPLDNSLDSGLSFSLDDVQTQRVVDKNKRKTHVHTGWAVVDGLSEDNCFRSLFCSVKKLMMFVQKVKQQF